MSLAAAGVAIRMSALIDSEEEVVGEVDHRCARLSVTFIVCAALIFA